MVVCSWNKIASTYSFSILSKSLTLRRSGDAILLLISPAVIEYSFPSNKLARAGTVMTTASSGTEPDISLFKAVSSRLSASFEEHIWSKYGKVKKK